jgi:hypothetical protein
VQRNSSFYDAGTPIPFEVALVNEGNAMDLTSGIFTAPRPGTYFFSFAGTAHLRSSSAVGFISVIFLNGNAIGSSLIQENTGAADQLSPLTLQSTLNFKKDDQVWVAISYMASSSSYLYEGFYRQTHFTGFMLEEEIVASI